MRVFKQSNDLKALAVAGSYVVVIGWDMPAETIRKHKVLGFALQRKRHSDGEVFWLSGQKKFEKTNPDPEPGVPTSSYKHPIQSFQWADYSVSPEEKYTYRLVARQGEPDALEDGESISLTVTCESIDNGKHAVHFNRGAIASQEYARRFQNRKPSEVGLAVTCP